MTDWRETYELLSPRERMAWDVLATDTDDLRELAEEHMVSWQTVRNIKMRTTKRSHAVHMLMIEHDIPAFTIAPSRRLSRQEVLKIRLSKTPSTVLAKEMNVSPSTVRMARSLLTYRDIK